MHTANQSEHNETDSTKGRTPIFENRRRRIGFISLHSLLVIIFVYHITSSTFSPTFEHYPTLPFARICGVGFTIFCLIILWRQSFAARIITPVLAFFLTVIYTQVNSELATLPTDDQEIKCAYAIFIASIVAIATLCIASQVISPNTSTENTDKNNHATDKTMSD